jgi:hypothetical protein
VISGGLLWLDGSPARYAAAAWVAFAAAVAVAFFPLCFERRPRSAWLLSPFWFAAGAVLAVAAFRWGSVLDNEELRNPDESQLISAALTLRHDPLYFRSIDGNTCGPVDEIPLALVAASGARMDFRLAHLAGLSLTLLGVGATWLTLRRLFGDAASRIAVLPLVASVAFCDFHEFLHYSTEPCPAALVAIALCCLAYAWDPASGRLSSLWLFRCGLALGAVSMAKLQAVPIAAAAALGALVLVVAAPGVEVAGKRRAAAWLVLGGVAVPAAFMLAFAYWGQWGEFTRSYIQNNFSYTSDRTVPWSESAALFLRMIIRSPGVGAFVYPASAFAAAASLIAPLGVRTWAGRMALVSAGVLAAAAFSTIAPGREYYHYLALLFIPVGFFGGSFLGLVLRRWDGAGAWVRAGIAASFVAVCVGPQVAWRARTPLQYQGLYSKGRGVMRVSEVAREVLRHAGRDDSLAIWGWTPRLWVETGLRQGTRDGSTIRQMDESPLQRTYQDRFIHDMRLNRPAVFVNAVGEDNFLKDRYASGYERYPALRDYIAGEYRLVREVETMRVYVRRDLP